MPLDQPKVSFGFIIRPPPAPQEDYWICLTKFVGRMSR